MMQHQVLSLPRSRQYEVANGPISSPLFPQIDEQSFMPPSNSNKRYWSNLSQSFTENPVETGSLEVQQKTEKLLYRAEKLESDATVETNVLAKAI